MKKKLKPIIKWTGGKYNEFALFAHEIPSFNRYIEPFFGGGGVFFSLQPNQTSFINDKSTDLINFYEQIGTSKLKDELFKYVTAWDELKSVVAILLEKFGNQFNNFVSGKGDINNLKDNFKVELDKILIQHNQLADPEFLVEPISFPIFLLDSFIDKAKRIKQITSNESRQFTTIELINHFDTGIRSGFYLFFRHILNEHFKTPHLLNAPKAAANWYFVREFCYGSMFRFNKRGEFNIPYGGISYNRKNLRQKVTKIFNEDVVALFKNTNCSNQDFEVFLNSIETKEEDFIFLDPPYDSEFSEYDQNSFTKKDQQRLANLLFPLPAKWMVIIKETQFIRQLYTAPSINIKVFEKSYSYNMRGRNKRAVKHLIITNYKLS
jgi:DNA adenine methylase